MGTVGVSKGRCSRSLCTQKWRLLCESEVEHLCWPQWEEGVRAGPLPGKTHFFPLSPLRLLLSVWVEVGGAGQGGSASALAGLVGQPGLS